MLTTADTSLHVLAVGRTGSGCEKSVVETLLRLSMLPAAIRRGLVCEAAVAPAPWVWRLAGTEIPTATEADVVPPAADAAPWWPSHFQRFICGPANGGRSSFAGRACQVLLAGTAANLSAAASDGPDAPLDVEIALPAPDGTSASNALSLRTLYRRWILETAAAAAAASAAAQEAARTHSKAAPTVTPPATILIVDVDFTAPGAVAELSLATPGAHVDAGAAPSEAARVDAAENDRECAAIAARLAVAAADGALLSPLWDTALVDPPRSFTEDAAAPRVRARGCCLVASSVDPFRPAVWAYEAPPALADEDDAINHETVAVATQRVGGERHQPRHGYEALARVLTSCVTAGPEGRDPNGAAWGVTDLYRSIVAALDAHAVLVAPPARGSDGGDAGATAPVLVRLEGFARVQPAAVGLHAGVFAQAMRDAVRTSRGAALDDALAAPCDPLVAFNGLGTPEAPPGAGGLACLRAVHSTGSLDDGGADGAGRATAPVVCRRTATLCMSGWDLLGATFTVAESDPETASFSVLRGGVSKNDESALMNAQPLSALDAKTDESHESQEPHHRRAVVPRHAAAAAPAGGDAASTYAAVSRLRALKKRTEESAAQDAHLDLCRRTHAQLAVAHRAFALLFDMRPVEVAQGGAVLNAAGGVEPSASLPAAAVVPEGDVLAAAREAGARYAALWWRVACAHCASRGPFGEERLARVLQAAVRAAARAGCEADGPTSQAAASYAASVVSASAATQRLLRQQTQLLSDPRLRDLARANIESIVQEATAEAEAELAALSPAQLEERRELHEHIRLRQQHRLAVRRAVALSDGADALRSCHISVAVPTGPAGPVPQPPVLGATTRRTGGARLRLHWRVFTRRVMADCDSTTGAVRAALGARLQCRVDPDAVAPQSFLATMDWVRLQMRLPLLERWDVGADGTKEAAAEQQAAALAAIMAASDLALQRGATKSGGAAQEELMVALASDVAQEVLQSALRVAATPDLAARIADAVDDSAAALLQRYQTHRALRGLAPLHLAGTNASPDSLPCNGPRCVMGLSAVYLSDPRPAGGDASEANVLDSRFFTVDCHADIDVEDATEATLLMSAVAGSHIPVCDAVPQFTQHLAASPSGPVGVDALLRTGVASAFYAGRGGWPIAEMAASDPDGAQIYPALLSVAPDGLALPAVAWTFGGTPKSEAAAQRRPNMAAFVAVLIESSVQLDAVISLQVDAPVAAATNATHMAVAAATTPTDHSGGDHDGPHGASMGGIDSTIQQSSFVSLRNVGGRAAGGSSSALPASSLLGALMVAERWTDLALRRVQRRMHLEASSLNDITSGCTALFAGLVPLPGVLAGSAAAPTSPTTDVAATTTRGASHRAAGAAASGALWFGVAPIESASRAALDAAVAATGAARAALHGGFAVSLAAAVAAAPSRKMQLLAAEHTRLVAAATRRWHDAVPASDFSTLLPRGLVRGPGAAESDPEAIATALEEEGAVEDAQTRAAAARTLLRLGKLLPSLRYFAPGPARERALHALLASEVTAAAPHSASRVLASALSSSPSQELRHLGMATAASSSVEKSSTTIGRDMEVGASWRTATPGIFGTSSVAGGGFAVARTPNSSAMSASPVPSAPPAVFDLTRPAPCWAPTTRVVIVAVVPSLGTRPALRATVLSGLTQVVAAFGSRGAAACWIDMCPSVLSRINTASDTAGAPVKAEMASPAAGAAAPGIPVAVAAVSAAVHRHVALALAAEERALGPALAPISVGIDGRLSHAGAALLVAVRLDGTSDANAAVKTDAATSWGFPCADAASSAANASSAPAGGASVVSNVASVRSVFSDLTNLLARYCM